VQARLDVNGDDKDEDTTTRIMVLWLLVLVGCWSLLYTLIVSRMLHSNPTTKFPANQCFSFHFAPKAGNQAIGVWSKESKDVVVREREITVAML
jgi:hypothetical protein